MYEELSLIKRLRHWRKKDRKFFEWVGGYIVKDVESTSRVEPEEGQVYFAKDTKKFDIYRDGKWHQGSI